MVQLKHWEKRIIDDALQMGLGYVLDFSDRTMAEFFEDEFSIQIFQESYAFNGSSKAKHMRAFIEVEDAATVVRVVRRMWEYREGMRQSPYEDASATAETRRKLFDLLVRIETTAPIASTEGIDRFQPNETLDELVGAIQRDIQADKPAVALGRGPI
ncbi:hypothetical protein [Aureimonas mangrovi]|uniref:hypothetical protein n=1 Tax=Aureimonas mangrovi TaxID=2758041 RepID=UPI00163DE44D|nr:hypothetical protein [Aureimonas mangrovi]